jgi:hypothetical protein
VTLPKPAKCITAELYLIWRFAYASIFCFLCRLDPCFRGDDGKAGVALPLLLAGAAAGYTRGGVCCESVVGRLDWECGHAGGDLDGFQ